MSTNDAPRISRSGQILLLILAVGISLAIVWITNRYQQELRDLGNYGYLGLFIISLIGNATLIIPAPVFVVACAAGLVYGPIGVGVVAGLGSALGELTGYLAGAGGKALMPQGRLHRSMQWQSPQGKQVQLEVERLVLHTQRHIALIRYQVTALNFDGTLSIYSGIDGAIRQSEHAEGDPRLGTQFTGDVLQQEGQIFSADAALMVQRTISTQFTVACGIRNLLNEPYACSPQQDYQSIGFVYRLEAQRGMPVKLDKFIAYRTSLDTEAAQVVPAVLRELEHAVATGFESLCTFQRDYLAEFRDVADIVIEGDDDALQRGMRFNIFHSASIGWKGWSYQYCRPRADRLGI